MRCRCVCGLCWCSLSDNDIGDAGAAAIGAALFHLPQLQELEYVLRPVVCTGSWSVLARERGAMVCFFAAVVCGLCSCSRADTRIGDAGAAAIGAGLVHVPQLQELKYVVCPTVSTGP